MNKAELTKGIRVIIPAGCGYTDYTTGIQRFCRPIIDTHCVVIEIMKNDIYLLTDNGRKVTTRWDIVRLEIPA